MPLTCTPTDLPGVLLFKPDVFGDDRGFFMEVFHRVKYAAFGPVPEMVQDNYSHSARGVLRGLHYQLPNAQAKLISVLRGRIFDVAVDIRCGSPDFGRWTGRELSSENRLQLYVPAGFAHGFCVLSDEADVLYKCSGYYAPESDRGIRWDDPAIGIAWPVDRPALSPKDERHPRLREVPQDRLPAYDSLTR